MRTYRLEFIFLQKKCKYIKGMKIDLEMEYTFIMFCKTQTDLLGWVEKTNNKTVSGWVFAQLLGKYLSFRKATSEICLVKSSIFFL